MYDVRAMGGWADDMRATGGQEAGDVRTICKQAIGWRAICGGWASERRRRGWEIGGYDVKRVRAGESGDGRRQVAKERLMQGSEKSSKRVAG